MAINKKQAVLKKLADLQQRLEEQVNFERYEFMERPEIAPVAKGRATAFREAALRVQLVRKEIDALWPDKNLNARSAK